MKFQPYLTSKPSTRKERNAMKAKERSRRNSPPGIPTKAQVRSERKVKTERRKFRQAVPKITQGAVELGTGMVNLASAARNATGPLREFARANAERMEKMTVRELRELAESLDVKTTTKMRKQEIIDLLASTRTHGRQSSARTGMPWTRHQPLYAPCSRPLCSNAPPCGSASTACAPGG